MTYLTDAVTEIPTDVENGAFLIVQETDVVDLAGPRDAKDYAERFYKRDRRYNDYLQTVAEEVDDGYSVMVMEDAVDEDELPDN